MIVSREVKLKLNLPVTNSQIEAFFEEEGLNVLRWAITEINEDLFTIHFAVEI